ncbi:MAG TPA: hypothetical protein VGL28_00910 [Steroidobacteraceae bacterium]|jgi:hypothetical protein
MFERDAVCVLDDIGTLRFSGVDVEKFLQGQLSNDVSALPPGVLLRAGLHNPQGRTLALLWLTASEQHDVLALLPRELLPTIAAVLRRYVLRAKVLISDDSDQVRVLGLRAPEAGGALPGQRVAYGARTDERALLLQSADPALPTPPSMPRRAWRALDLAAGLPQVYAATSGQFVAQMLNLDCVDAISFSKGCYTGQEVIARAHYRGRIKRRMQRFVSHAALTSAPGDSGRLSDGRSFRVVEALQLPDGRCEFLAVTALPGGGGEGEGGAAIACSELALPYALPD